MPVMVRLDDHGPSHVPAARRSAAGPGITDVKSHRHESSFRLVRAGGGGSLPGGSGLRRPRPQRHLKSQPVARRARARPSTEADCDGNRDGDRGLRLTRHSGWQFSASDSDGEPTAAAAAATGTEGAAPRPRRPGSGPRPRRHWYCCTLALPGRRLSLRVTVTPVAVTSPTELRLSPPAGRLGLMAPAPGP